MKPHVLFYLYFPSPDMDPLDDTYTALNHPRTRSPDYENLEVSPSHNQADNWMGGWTLL